jgi:perosamine synthetase
MAAHMLPDAHSAGRELLDVLRSVVPPAAAPVALHEPQFDDRDAELVLDCLRSTFVSSVGKYVDRLETMLAEYTGARHAVVVASGTAALHIAMKMAGVQQNDEVLIPALCFVATANSVAHCGAVPHFVDSDASTLGMDPEALAAHLAAIGEISTGELRNRHTGRRIAAIVPMHTYGHPVRLSTLLEVAARFRVPVVEDAAESLGSSYEGKHTGTFGLLGTLSFNGNKVITTGGGGAILTDDRNLARHAKHVTTTAKRAHRWEFFHDEIAYNYRMPNLNAALGCSQMERLDGLLIAKRELAEHYRRAFAHVRTMKFIAEPAGTRSNYWLSTVRLTRSDFALRDALLTLANEAGYQCRPTWTLLHKLPMFSLAPRAAVPVAESLEASLINLPSSPKLGVALRSAHQ